MNAPPPALLFSINHLDLPDLRIDEFSVARGQCWAVVGRNGAGNQHLGRLLGGELDPPGETVRRYHGDIRILSFEDQQRLYEQELRDDDSEFMEGADSGTPVRELLGLDGPLPERLGFLRLDALLDRGYRLLSSGEARKTLLARALLANPDLLILDEPFDSLDAEARAQLVDYFARLSRDGGPTLLFLLNTLDDVFDWHTHLAVIDRGELLASGEAGVLREDAALKALLSFDPSTLPDWPPPLPAETLPDTLIALHQGRVRYGGQPVFEQVDLVIRQGEHTLLTGANGSGKSTLLGLITGDHPQCYSNDLTLFGIRRGSGETIWDLKKRIGIVSAGLHRDHRVPGSALEIVLSGFHDSIGLYDAVNPTQTRHAHTWLALTGMAAKAQVPFKRLSYGEQRLVLIARALVKQPALLVLDEPTQGLDAVNRRRMMAFLEHLSGQHRTTIIMASHREDERLPLFRQHIHLS